MTTIQTETLSEHLYLGTYKEMVAHARESDSVVTVWTDEPRQAEPVPPGHAALPQ